MLYWWDSRAPTVEVTLYNERGTMPATTILEEVVDLEEVGALEELVVYDPLAKYRHREWTFWESAQRDNLTQRIAEQEENLANNHNVDHATWTIRYCRGELAKLDRAFERSTASECTLIRAILEWKDIHSSSLAFQVSMSDKRIHEYVTGQVIPTPATMRKIFHRLEASMDELMTYIASES